jgi:hypothetical protein
VDRTALRVVLALACKTQTEIANELGISNSYMNKMIAGERPIPDWVAERLPAAAFSRSIDEQQEREPA